MKIAMSRSIVEAALGLCLHVLPAQADNVRSFVSATSGSDSNSCGRAAPCRTFAGALSKTVAGGEINTLDPGGYGTVTIAKSISIVSGLGEAGVLVPAGGTGITVNAGPNDIVNLRGLIIEGAGTASIGIQFTSGGSLNIQNSVIRGVTGTGLNFTPNASSTLFVSNTLVSDFTNVSGVGINIFPTSGAVVAVLNRADILRIGGTAVNAGTGATVNLRDSTIVGNAVGVNFAGGTVVSYGNNAITNNTTNVQGGTIPEQGAHGPVGQITQASSAPTCSAADQAKVYFNTADKHFYGCDGTGWVAFGFSLSVSSPLQMAGGVLSISGTSGQKFVTTSSGADTCGLTFTAGVLTASTGC